MTIFKADPTGAALYSGNDDLPFDNPKGNLSRVHYSSKLNYLAFPSSTPTFDRNIAVISTVASRQRTISIGSHGRSGIPFVFGRVLAFGEWTPLSGGVPVYMGARVVGGLQTGKAILWHLAVSASGVFIVELRSDPTFTIGLPTLRVQVWVSHNIMD